MKVNSTSVQTHSGKYFDYADPKPDQVNLLDIGQSLARECRYNGQTTTHYSVAQHSVLVSLLVPKEYALYGLLHDASEAYMRDIATPLKLLLPNYRKIEDRAQAAIYERFGMDPVLTEDIAFIVKKVDAQVFMAEREQLMPADGLDWPGIMNLDPITLTITEMNAQRAESYFLERFDSIQKDLPFQSESFLWASQHNEWNHRMSECQQSRIFNESLNRREKLA